MSQQAKAGRYRESWGECYQTEVLLNDAVCSSLYAHESKKSQELGILDPQMLTRFLGELLKTESFSS